MFVITIIILPPLSSHHVHFALDLSFITSMKSPRNQSLCLVRTCEVEPLCLKMQSSHLHSLSADNPRLVGVRAGQREQRFSSTWLWYHILDSTRRCSLFESWSGVMLIFIHIYANKHISLNFFSFFHKEKAIRTSKKRWCWNRKQLWITVSISNKPKQNKSNNNNSPWLEILNLSENRGNYYIGKLHIGLLIMKDIAS